MTEQEILKKLNDCDQRIAIAYNELVNTARAVGTQGYDAARITRQNAISEATHKKIQQTLYPLLLSLLGLAILMEESILLGLLLIGGGIYLSYTLYGKADAALKEVQSRNDAMLKEVEMQRNSLYSTLDRNTVI